MVRSKLREEIKHIFFDLDCTLWDFEKSSSTTLEELFKEFELSSKGIVSLDDFLKVYYRENEKCWVLYRKNIIDKPTLRIKRYCKTLEYFGIDNLALAEQINSAYISRSPYKPFLIDGVNSTLRELKSRGYQLHIITNGFEETQHVKLKSNNIHHFFNTITISDSIGIHKPNKRIFNIALDAANAKPNESVMVGDDLLSDVEGAINVGMKAIYFNSLSEGVTNNKYIEINSISELVNLL